MALGTAIGLGALAAAPWLIRSAPGIARGAQSLWNLGRGMGTAGGRSRAAQAAWGAGRPAHTTVGAQAPRGASGYKVPPVPQFDSTMADMTTVKKITDDASPNTITQTIKQQVPANPTNTLMNMGRKFMGGWQDLARKRHEEEMLRRQR